MKIKSKILFVVMLCFLCAGCHQITITKDIVYIPLSSKLPCSLVERSIKKDETTYSLYSPLWEKAPVIDKEYTEANNKDNVYIYNLGYLPDDFHTISTKCLHSEYAMTRDEIWEYQIFPYTTYLPQKRKVEEKVILDFLLALQTQNFIRAEQILNNSIQKEWGLSGNLLPLIQRKLLISKAGANELFILSENGDAQHLNYLIQRVFIENSLLYVEKLYSYFILQPSFKTDNLSEIEKQELCKKQFFDDTTNISADVQRNNVILNPLNHFLDEKDSIRLCVEFYDFYSKNWYENIKSDKIIEFTWYEELVKNNFYDFTKKEQLVLQEFLGQHTGITLSHQKNWTISFLFSGSSQSYTLQFLPSQILSWNDNIVQYNEEFEIYSPMQIASFIGKYHIPTSSLQALYFFDKIAWFVAVNT